jgi:hypothetical protein
MPHVTITCVCGVTTQRYVSPSHKGTPRFCSRLCMESAAPIGSVNRKYEWTAERDHAVRVLWSEVPWGQRRQAALRDPLLAFIPYGAIKWRAMRLGLRRDRYHDGRMWTPAEDAILERFGGEVAAEALQQRLQRAGHHRTLSAIVNRLGKRYQRSAQGAALTAHDVAKILGWEFHAVSKWIAAGDLVAGKSGGGGRYRITRRSVARFVRAHPETCSKRPVDMAMVVEILDQYPIDEERTA